MTSWSSNLSGQQMIGWKCDCERSGTDSVGLGVLELFVCCMHSSGVVFNLKVVLNKKYGSL